MKRVIFAFTAVAALVSLPAYAADITVLASNGVKAAFDELAPAFERATSNKVAVKYGLAAVLKRNIEAGEYFDLAVLTSAGIADLAKQSKVATGSERPVARSGVGIMIREGTPKPDLSSSEALKRAMLAAKSVTWAKEGASGTYFISVLQKLRIADEVMRKANLAVDGADAAKKVANGQAQLGALLINEIMAQPGVVVAGPLPASLQNYTVFHSGVSAATKNTVVAKEFAEFLTKPESQAVFKAKGQEPG
jgi:molybdate transport system substrate-binding protein